MIKESYSIEEISRMTGLSTRTIRNYLNNGLAHASKIDGKWAFSQDDFVAMIENPYIAAAINAKNNAPVWDFINDKKKKGNSACLIIDRTVSVEEADSLQKRISELMQTLAKVKFRFERKNDHIRIILSGDEDEIRKFHQQV